MEDRHLDYLADELITLLGLPRHGRKLTISCGADDPYVQVTYCYDLYPDDPRTDKVIERIAEYELRPKAA